MDLSPLRWQSEALDAWIDAGRRGIVAVVTGGGKTVFALLAFAEFRAQEPQARLLVLVPTAALLDQWVVNITDLEVAVPEDIATYSGAGRASQPRRVNVALINTARTWASSITAEGPWMLVVDECHRAASPANSRALVSCEASLGLSATPERQYDDGFERHLVPTLGPVIYEYSYRAALADGVVAPFELHNFEFELASSEKAEYDRLSRRIAQRTSNRPDEDPRSRAETATERLLFARARVVQSARLRVPSAVALVERFSGRALVFHERIDGAEAISRLLDLRGHRVATYHSQLSVSFRQRNLRLFKRGEIDVLVTCRALDEGLNVPDAETAIIASSTKSTRQRIQRLGRVLRARPEKLARVATLYATPSERSLLIKEARNLEDVTAVRWYSIEQRAQP